MKEKGIRSGRHDEAVIALLIRVMDGMVAGRPPSAALQDVPLPSADLAMADRLARATTAGLGALAVRWRGWDADQKRAYMGAVLASWKAKKKNEAAQEWFERRVVDEDGLDVQAGGPAEKGGADGGEGV